MNQFTYRKVVIMGIVIGTFVIFIFKLLFFQVLDDRYKILADNNSQRTEIQYPARGLIYDRNGVLLVDNQASYDLMILPRQVKEFDTLELLSILDITKETLDKNIDKCKKYATYKPSVLISQISGSKYALLQEKLYRFPGFYITTRTMRKYNIPHSADVFGYIGEVNREQLNNDSYYNLGDYVGESGLEKAYEKHLRGEKGKRIILVDNLNREKGSFNNGEYDVAPVIGKDLITTLDIDLQNYAFELMQNKRGGIIAIEPKTGEILVKVTAPSYDPQLMVGLERGKNYTKLLQDTFNTPLFDRTTNATYPPGSIFKTVQALIGLETGAITTSTQCSCSNGASYPGGFMRCHAHSSPVDLRQSIQTSCNPYYVNVFRRILELPKYKGVNNAYEAWRNYVLSFGFGSKICPDFLNERSGDIPTREFYERYHGKNMKPSNIVSLSIGQGELLITPLQMANLAAILANRGYYHTPHIVKPIENVNKIEKYTIPIESKHFEPVVEGMELVCKYGTGRNAQVDSIRVAGKTGTVQNPHGDDHSVFIAFAPAEDPKIALVVYVEKGVWGARYAAPIAGLLIEKYLKGEISQNKKTLEKTMFEANLLN